LGAGLLLSGALLGLSGCAAKKPINVQISGCVVQRTWQDEQGRERKDCACQNGKEIGIDARTGARIVRCE